MTFHVARLAIAEILHISAHPSNRSARAVHARSWGGRRWALKGMKLFSLRVIRESKASIAGE